MNKKYLILIRNGCPYCFKLLKFMDDNTIIYFKKVSGKDFRHSSFKEKFGTNATFPRVYEIKKNGKKVFLGGCEETMSLLMK